jgi:toxin ParE1/3/4
MKLRILGEAQEETKKAREYLNRQSRRLGRRFLNEIATRLSQILTDPYQFPKVETLPDESQFRRALLHVFPYIIVFEVCDDMILIIAVAHCSQEPNYWLSRTQ